MGSPKIFRWGAAVAAWIACVLVGQGGCGSKTSGGGSSDSGSGQGAGGTPLPVACEQDCEMKFPNGAMEYRAFHSCLVCGACRDLCTKEVSGGCKGMDADKGCSAMFMSCADCAASTCAAHQKPDTMFDGACAAEGNACAGKPDCVALSNCTAKCIITTGPGGPGGGGGAGGAGGMMTMTTTGS